MNEEEVKERIKMLERSKKNYIHKFKQRQNKKWKMLEQQLQAYKDKEDKLRELLKNTTLENIKCDCNCLRNFVGNIEQILNEGE